MKLLISFVVFVSSLSISQSKADEPKDLTLFCANSVSSASVVTKDDRVIFRFDDGDADGFASFPLYDGNLTPAMTPLVLRGIEELKVLRGTLVLSWDKKTCRIDANNKLLFNCSGRGKVEIPTTDYFTPTGVSTTLVQESTIDFKNNETLKINVGLDTPKTNYTHYYLAFPFTKANCMYK